MPVHNWDRNRDLAIDTKDAINMKRPLEKKYFLWKKELLKLFVCLFTDTYRENQQLRLHICIKSKHRHCRSMTLRCPWKSSRTFICKHCFHDGTSYLGLQLHRCFQVLDAKSPREQQSPASQAPGTTFMEDNSSTGRGWGWGERMVWGWFKHMTLIVHFISIIIPSAPPQIPRSGRSAGEGNGNPLRYPWLGNPMDKRSLVGCSPWGRKKSDTT